MTDAPVQRAGPGSGPGGAPTAIALSPILSARYRARDLERIRAAAPGRAPGDGLGRGARRRSARRRRGHAPRLAQLGSLRPDPRPGAPLELGPLGDVGRGAGAHPGRPRARPRRHQCARRLQPADRRVRPDDDPGGQPPAAAAPRAPARADVAAARRRRAARCHGRDRRARLDRPGGRDAGDRIRVPGRRRPAASRGGLEPGLAGRGRRRDRRGHLRSRRWPRDAAGAARRVRFHRPRGAAHPRDRGDDQRVRRSGWSSPGRGSSTSRAAG